MLATSLPPLFLFIFVNMNTPTMKRRRTYKPFSPFDREFIKQNQGLLDPENMALHLQVPALKIARYLSHLPPPSPPPPATPTLTAY
jgi:hypothetical protein